MPSALASSSRSRAAGGVNRVLVWAVEAELRRHTDAIERKAAAGHRPRAERRFVQPRACVDNLPRFAQQHLCQAIKW